MSVPRLLAILFCFLSLYSVAAGSLGSETVKERLDRVERMLGNKALMDLLARVDDLQYEIRELRGRIEVQNHTISRMKQDQRNHYLDLDKRLQRIESPAGSGMAPPAQKAGRSTGKISSVPKGTGATGSRSSARETPEPSTSPSPLQTTGPASADYGQEQQDYQVAFALLKKGDYKKAITALGVFLEKYPHGQYADSAQYWLGETYYVTQQYRSALKAFRQFLDKYPSSSNFIDGLLKIGYIQHELGRKTKARQTLTDLIERYPGTTEAHLAKERLRKIQN
uniref:Cell division coordinator CpoB n=1 Tax=Candidatus Kentrum sp. FM TaxID=2126340 RepID=A0A450TRD7_9GAMM|nr:MAG: tol-pal system protein YbgF [Candidatus Kentron sp. FM]VFJ70601.1 MAG: tol-pal system protein YbgF [Candidatus Kentron sp. FM]VFK18312.1 MAG: tol-pal system protein YbgF [Candidatus Kentron sp. FM]